MSRFYPAFLRKRKPPPIPAYLEAAFMDGWEVTTPYGRLTVECRMVGVLQVVTGRIVACDASLAGIDEPFEQLFESGSFPVILSIARNEDEDGDERIACAIVRFHDAQPVLWENTIPAVFGVDSGTACFMDINAAKLFHERGAGRDNEWWDEVHQMMDQNYVETRSWANILLDERTGLNAVIFDSGFGDGVYASFVARDSEARIVRLVTDFDILVEGEPLQEEKQEEDVSPPARWWQFWRK